MANNENTVQIQVEVLRAQLDKLIADINSLKNQNISVKVDTAGAAALEQLSDAVQQMRTGLQELDAQLGQNAAAFSGMGNSAQAAVQALLQYISQVNQAASAEMQALAVRRQTTAATEEQASAAGTAAQAVSQMADAQRQESDADAQFLARLTAGNSALEDRAGQIRQLIDLYAQMQRIRASGAAGQSVPMLEAGDYEVFGQGTSHGPTVAQGSVIDVDWTDAARGAREYAGAASDAADATGQAVTQSDGLVDSFGRLFPQLTVWQLTRDAVNALVQELKAALETMKDVDTELTAIQKVTNNTDAQMSKIGEHGYDVASKYGVSVTDYLSSVGSFSKAGYKEMSEDMAELATKTQLVGDVNADTANKFLLSADAAFKLEGNVAALSKVLDAANTIENEYATEIQKIAEGFPLVANVASMANMTAEQLTAALGTITAATQESGSMAARAMRALILNIMGDTETELEDGITWTKDEIESLSQILWTYSEDAMKAAQATGSIVNPMEAVAGLAKAYKEGVLTQAELAQFESDLGGKLRTNQLDALIQHYDMYLEMLDKVTTSAGSADREIGTMLDSWQSKANILDNKWTELVNHMIETESVKGGLETVTELVELLDTDLGHIILTLAAAETGVFAIAAAVKSFQRVGSVLQLGSLSPWLLGIGAAITGIVVAVQAAQKAYAAAHPSIDKLNQDWEENRSAIQKTKEALEEYTDKLRALEQVEPADRTGQWQDEYAQLSNNKEIAEAYLDTLEEIAKHTGKKLYGAGHITGYSGNNSVIENYDDTGKKYYTSKISGAAISNETVSAARANYNSELAAANAIAKTIPNFDWGKLEGLTESQALEKMLSMLGTFGIQISAVVESTDEAFTKVDEWASSYDKLTDAQKKNAQQYLADLQNMIQTKEVSDEQADAYLRLAAAAQEIEVSSLSAGDAIQFIANNTGLTVEESAKLADELGYIDSANTRLAQGFVQLADGTWEYRSACEKAADGTWKLKNAEDGAADSADDMTGALGDVEVATYDANTAAAKLTKSLFDANGKLTEHAKKALTTNTALADLAKKELELQNAAATANYNNLIAQIQAVGSSAIITSQQIQQMIGLIPGMTSNTWSAENQEFNMRRLFNQQTGKNWKKDAEDYAQWSSQYLLKKSSEYYKKQQEEYKRQMEELSKYTSDYTGTSTGGGGGSSSDANLDAHKQKVELLKSELTLLEKQNASEDTQKDKMRQIQQALHAQAQYLRSIGGSQVDINALSAEWWEWQEKINGTLKSTDDLLNELQDVMADKLSDLSEQRQNELDEIDKQIESFKLEKETRDEQLTLEEKILAVQQAQAKLANAQNERTVRQFNARTGQWEWVADQKEVDSVQESLDEAKKDLEDFKANMAYEAALAELEAQKKTINERYDDLETAYKDFLKSIKEKTRGIGEILQDIWKNATPELRQIIQENAELFRQFGIDVSQLSDAVNDTAHKIVRVGAGGNAPSGLSVGDRVVTGGGTYEITGVNPDGSYTSKLVDANQTIWNYDGQYDTVSGNNSGNTTGGGQKYTGTVWAKRNDGNGVDYKISSARGLDFLNNEPAGATMTGSDGSYWVKNADGTTSITNKYGVGFTVYDKGGILHGMGGIKATMQDEGITPPDVTAMLKKRVLTPVEDRNFSQNMDSIRWMMASNRTSANEVHNASYDSHNIGTMIAKQINCTINGMKVSPQEAHALTLEKLANIAHNLGNFS